MKRAFRTVVCMFFLFMLFPALSGAADRITFVVLPFSVNGPQGYAYLERSIPQMLTSRLYWKDRVQSAVLDLPASVKPVSTEGAAEKLRAQYKADYVVWGSVNVVNEDCSLDVYVRDQSGRVWPYSREAKAPQLMTAIKAVSEAINRDVFGKTGNAITATTHTPATASKINPDLIDAENKNQDKYLNRNFRYSGRSAEDDSRIRSQALNFNSIGMEVVDANGDGKNEVLILDDHKIRAYHYNNGALTPLGEQDLPSTLQPLSIRSLKRPTGLSWIVISAVNPDKQPASRIYTFDGKNFKEEMRNIKYFLNVVKLSPGYVPTLIGQASQTARLFKGGVYQMVRQGDKLQTAGLVSLPSDANVFNFAYLPAGSGGSNEEKIIVLSPTNERLRTYTNKQSRLSESSDSYSGAAVGLAINPAVSGMGKEKVTQASIFYIPMRMVATDIERDGNYELIVNKPISTASQIFDRYRFFPQSEIHSLFWDGLGLNLQWKTSRIKGSMVDYTITDIDNNGSPDLVVCLNTHPGALGVNARKTMVVVYPLDLSMTDPSTPVDKSEIYD